MVCITWPRFDHHRNGERYHGWGHHAVLRCIHGSHYLGRNHSRVVQSILVRATMVAACRRVVRVTRHGLHLLHYGKHPGTHR